MKERLHLLRIRTPEGAEFSFHLASPLLRMAAITIDWATIAVTWSLVSILISLLKIISLDMATWVMTLGYFLLSSCYDMLFEWLWRGQTLGKRVVGLRVVDASGMRLSFPQIVMRNLLRYIDILPGAYLVGGLTALIGSRGQRLGDLAAGTIVIWEAPVPQPDLTAFQEAKYNSLRRQQHIVARLRQAVRPEQAQAAWLALRRRDQLEAASRVRLFAEIAAYFKGLTHLPADATEGVSDEQFVRNVVEVLYRQ